MAAVYRTLYEFLSTPSARRATSIGVTQGFFVKDFYPRPPRGGRPLCLPLLCGEQSISIHALREEGDGNTKPPEL